MSVRGDLRLAQLQAMRSTAPSDLEAFAASLEAACRRVLPHLTGEPALDIVRIAVFRGDGETGSDCELEGYAEEGTRRLWCAFDHRADNIEVYISITKGDAVASCEMFGKSGPGVGNLALFARIFDLTIECAIACGLKAICNQPNDAVVRRLYARMGFHNGESLALDDRESLLRALRFIEAAYDGAVSRHPGFKPPW